MAKRWGFFQSLLILSPLLVGIPLFAVRKHYELPRPLVELYDPKTNEPQLSEHAILGYAKHLSETIGFRTVGTREHALGDEWMLQKAEELQNMCENVVAKEPGRNLECEVWRQVGSGSHRFDILHARLYKTYVNLSNIVLRISDGTPAGKENAVLVNAHLDSTIPSPGAADDALSVGVMIEAARVLINTPGWSPSHAIVFLWNNAEESLQDGSHLFATAHPTRDTVRAMINLEAAGTGGPELLFQATSEQMIEAYSHVPRPYGTVVANEVFSSGIILSDTDFRQFELYLNVSGLDMAIVGHSYFYHTQKDLVEFIEPGAAQHMAENTLALLKYLSSSSSPLPKLTSGYTKPSTVFFSLANSIFIQYSFSTANALHLTFLASSLLLIALTSPARTISASATTNTEEVVVQNGGTKVDIKVTEVIEELRESDDIWIAHLKGVAVIASSFIGALLGANVTAVLMREVINRPLSWYRVEYSCLLLYGPAALAGGLGTFNVLSTFIHSTEQTLYTSTLLGFSLLAVLLQAFGIGSAALFFLSACPIFVGAALLRQNNGHVPLSSYAIGQLASLFLGTEVFCSTSDIFVPLTGRIGSNAPADYIIATIVALSSSYFLPLSIPFISRFGTQFRSRSVTILLLLTIVSMAVFALRNPYDSMHPKRLFFVHSENVTTGEVSLNIGTSDSAPNFDVLVQEIAHFVTQNTTSATAVDLHAYTGDWNVLYPFSPFLSPFKVELDSYVSSWAAEDQFSVEALNDVVDTVSGTRSLTIVVYHPGLIWTTIAFDAHILEWSMDDNPPAENARHYVKEASFYGEDTWSIDVVFSLHDFPDPANAKLRVDFVGIKEKEMWPGKKHEEVEPGPAMQLFEDLDGWLLEHTSGSVDALMIGCVGGVVEL